MSTAHGYAALVCALLIAYIETKASQAVHSSTSRQRYRPRHSAAYVACALAAYWLFLALRHASTYWLDTPAGRVWAIQDDMYISASFARTLVDGGGLRWYVGAPKVEGFSNPAWVAAMALFHALPRFSETALGALLFAVNATALTLLAATVVNGLLQLPSNATTSAATWRWWLVLAVAPACASLCVAAGNGFEMPLLALFATLAFVESMRPRRNLRPVLIGALIGLAFWTRMDGLVPSLPAFALALFRLRDRRALAKLLLTLGAMIVLLLCARRLYYGEWYPNTYFLKVTGWPLSNRLAYGWFQNRSTALALGCGLLPVLWLGFTGLERRDRPVLVALSAAPLSVAYSTTNGGDFIWPSFGYDRFASASTALFVLAVAAVALKARLTSWQAPFFAAGVTLSIGVPSLLGLRVEPGPVFGYAYNAAAAHRLFDPRPEGVPERELLAAELIYRGLLLEELSEPAARIAVCDAGALIYFSRRGGVDVLGKIEPYIAHMPAMLEPPPERRCWRNFAPSGHNKEDVPGLFQLRRPQLSQIVPPSTHAHLYVPISYKGRRFYARRNSPVVRWHLVTFPIATLVPESR